MKPLEYIGKLADDLDAENDDREAGALRELVANTNKVLDHLGEHEVNIPGGLFGKIAFACALGAYLSLRG